MMQLTRPELSYFIEMGNIAREVENLRNSGLRVKYCENGIQIESTRKDGSFSLECYHTSRELKAYLNGIEDGWHAHKDGAILSFKSDGD